MFRHFSNYNLCYCVQGEEDINISENAARMSKDEHAEHEEDQTKSASQSPIIEKSGGEGTTFDLYNYLSINSV